ncbi:phasin family protein [Robiginitomaculum antarcticum]|uniref:phasin family protein n=1 Tax=Robiginitomaculum antarcticum TaxID=437507 RepID=UPI00036789DB|nr:phasin family protein [Robiginitomaculum antarcticum]
MAKKSEKSGSEKRSTSDTARRIWLAGIGAYGRAFTEAQGAIKDVTGKSSAVFDELVQKGQVFEAVGKAKGKEIVSKAQVPDIDIDSRIKSMREKIKEAGSKSSDWVEDHVPDFGRKDSAKTDIESRLDVIEAKLDAVMRVLNVKVAPKVAAKKRAVKKQPVKKIKTQRTPAKPVVSKPAAKKTAAKKPPTKKPPAKKAAVKKPTTKKPAAKKTTSKKSKKA